MTATNKQSLISKSVAVIRIGIHPIGVEEPDNMLYAWPLGSHIQQPSVKFLPDQNWAPAPGMKSWLSAIIRPDRHPGLPHSPSTKPPQSRDMQFDKVVTKLLGLSDPIKPNMWSVQIKTCPSGLKQWIYRHIYLSIGQYKSRHPSVRPLPGRLDMQPDWLRPPSPSSAPHRAFSDRCPAAPGCLRPSRHGRHHPA
jgi:hypothetical protein